MSKDKFDGHILPHGGVYGGKRGVIGEYGDKLSDKTRRRLDLSTHDTKFGKRGDVEEWKKGGAALYRLSNGLYEDRAKVLSERGGVQSIAAREGVQEDANLTRCLRGVSAKFWGSGTRMFCAYYEKDSSGKYGIYFAVFTENDTRVIKVSDAVFTKSEAKRAPPDFVMRKEGDTQKVIFTFLVQKERGERTAGQELSFLFINQYTISEQDRGIVVEKLGSVLSSKDYLGFKGPLGITVHSDGDIIVIGKFKDLVRLSSSDVGYFAWKFSSADLALIRPKGSHGYDNTYLFCVFGGSAYRNSERMVVWDDARENQLSITHIDKHLIREHFMYSTAYTVRNVDMIYREDMAERCLIESLRCGISGPQTSVLRNEDVHLMDNVSVGGARYIFYISQKSDKKANGTLDMLMFSGDTYLLVEGIFHIGFSATSLSVNPISNGDISIFLTEKGRERAHVYEIPSGDELLKSEILIKTAVIDYSDAEKQEFINIINGKSLLRGKVETVTDLETSITKGSLKDLIHSRKYEGTAKVVNYGVHELENSAHSPAYVVTEKGAQSDAYPEHHTFVSRHGISVSETITTLVGSLLREGGDSSVSSTVTKDLPREEPSSTALSPVEGFADTTATRRVVATKVHRGVVTRRSSGSRYGVEPVRHLASLSKAIVRGSSANSSANATGTTSEAATTSEATRTTSAATGGGGRVATMFRNYSGYIGTGGHFVSPFASTSSSLLDKESWSSEVWIILGVIAVLFVISAVGYVYRLITRSGRGGSNLYRNMYDNAVEEDVSFIQLEPRNATVDEIPSTLCMESISSSLTSHNCGSVHEL